MKNKRNLPLIYPPTCKQRIGLAICRQWFIIGLSGFSCLSVPSHAENLTALQSPAEFSLLGGLSNLGLHNLQDEWWNAYGQATYIYTFKNGFPAAYTNLNGSNSSLTTDPERGFTATVTAYIGVKAWRGAEFYAAPEMISELPLSGLKGLGGSIQNFELQKNGAENSTWYLSRAIYRQTIPFGGTTSEVKSGSMQLAGTVSSRRFVFTAGTFSILDYFDRNTYAADLRRQFVNMAFLTNAAYDFAADARGYTSLGFVGEFYYDDWAFRIARIAGPKDPNDLPVNFSIFEHYGDQIEIEHKHTIKNQSGAIRILGYRNRERSGRFSDAIAAYQLDPSKSAANCTSYNYESSNASAPDLCWVRKPNIKMGIGINMEQALTDDVGFFLRGMYSDGETEVYSYIPADRSFSLGTSIKGERWGRDKDSLGIAYGQSWISDQHVAYLNRGGVDGFIGDGKINYQPEQVVDIYYQWHVFTSTWLSLDYQHISNPAFNADRGPVDMYNGRLHFEF